MIRFWNFFIEQYRFTYLLTGVIILLGLVSTVALPKESNPEVTVPIGIVRTIYPGASPVDVEKLVTNKLEDEIRGLDDLDTVSSNSAEGVSVIVVKFNPKADIEGRIRALKDAVDVVVPDLPDDAETPVTEQVSVNDEPILVVSIALDAPQKSLTLIGQTLQDELESIVGVSEAKLLGVRKREIQVTADLRQLDRYGLSIRDLVGALRQQDAQVPVGALEQGSINHTVRFEGGIENPAMLSSLPVGMQAGEPIRLGDVAAVTDGLEEVGSFYRLSLQGKRASPSIGVEIYKGDGNDALGVVAAVKSKILKLQGGVLKGAEVNYSQDRAERISKDLSNLLFNGVQTIIIVFLLLYLFLGFREAVLAGFCVPMTFLMAFLGLYAFGYTINFLSLFSLILSLGILVDSSIVIVEGMHKYLFLGETPIQAAKKTLLEFQAPVISGIMTTVSAFIPMMFSSGVTGQYIRVIPVTVIMVLISSLFVGLAIIPVLGAGFLKVKKSADSSLQEKDDRVGFMQRLSAWYELKLKNLLDNAGERRLILVVLTVLFVASLLLPITGVLKSTLFPVKDAEQVFVDVELPIGTSVELTNLVVSKVEEGLYGEPLIASFVSSSGVSSGQSAQSSGGQGNIGRISISLVDKEDRALTSGEFLQKLRGKLPQLVPEATLLFSQINAGPPQGKPVEISFTGADIRELERLATDAEHLVKNIEGTADVARSTLDTPFEYALVVNRSKVAQVGLNPLAIAQILRTVLYGVDALELRLDDEDVQVVVQLNLNPNTNDPHMTRRANISALEAILIPTKNGSVPLSALVDTRVQSGTDAIQHEDGLRVAKVTAALKPGFTTQEVIQAFQQQLEQLQLLVGYSVSYGGEAEDVAKSFTDLYYAMVIGLFLIASILVLQFNSYRQPFFILIALPLALIGVLPGLTITGQALSFPAFIGIVALLGIVVNDAIILIDQVNVNRRGGMAIREALLAGGTSRLQPILLTTITTVAGILPLTLSDDVWGPLGFTIIFGLMFSTILTLVVIPILYYRYEKDDI